MLKKIIISRGRADFITTHKLISDCNILVPYSERDKYYKKVKNFVNDIDTIPDEIIGLAKVRNFVIKNYSDDVVMIDDDITSFYSVVREKAYKIRNRDFVSAMLDEVYECALGANVCLFSIGQTRDIRKIVYSDPFKLSTWVGSVVGIIGKDYYFDENLKVRVDVDFSLTQLMEKRRVWVDNRYAFYSKKDFNIGGSSVIRSKEVIENDKKYLKKKWGKYIVFSYGKSKDSVKLNVDRKERSVF